MQPSQNNHLASRIVITLLLLILIYTAGLELSASFSAPQSWENLLTPLQIITITTALLLFVAGMTAVFLMIWKTEAVGSIVNGVGHLEWPRWVALTGILLFVIWFLLFSVWQVVFTGIWTRLLFLLAITGLVALSFRTEKASFGWREVVLGMVWLLYVGMVQEARQMTPFAIIYHVLTVIGAFLASVVALLLYRAEVFSTAGDRLVAWRDQSSWLRRGLGLLLSITPVILLYAEGRMNYGTFPFIRLSVLALILPGLAMLISKQEKRLTTHEGWITAAGILLFISVLSNRLINVTDSPFSIGWSEGNRFYDYSLIFASDLYNYSGKLEVPYFAPGRYALWGSLFLIPGLPIWVHRLWNVFLQTAPALATGCLLARPIRTSRWYLPFLFWMTLYLLQGPVMPPLLVALLLFLPFMFVKNPWMRAASLVATSLAAGLSRWTWAVGPGTWGALMDLFLYYPQRKGGLLRRILPTIGLALLGVLPGIIASWANVWNKSSDFIGKQPLLWYRLWSNETNPTGILRGILLASGPLVILLIWLAISRRWKMDWVQAAAAVGASLAFLGAGIVMSMKIGGGGDLHNLDLFLLTTALLAGLAAYALHQSNGLNPSTWPRWAQVVLALFLLIPAWSATRAAVPNPIPPFAPVTDPSLMTLQAIVASYQQEGEILFMDQRQLLTFGYIKDVPFTPDYEKKYMMDQAMGGNATYFTSYYHDLAERRFALIITEPLNTHYFGLESTFGEENDAWVGWVSIPTLCFYEPMMVFQDIGVELLVPRGNIEACNKYVNQ